MARNGVKTGGRDFKKGNPGGPGRPAMPADQKAAWAEINKMRSKARFDFQHCFDQMQDWGVERLAKFVADCTPRQIKKKGGETTYIPPKEEGRVVELMAARLLLRVLSSGRPHEVQTTHELVCGPEPKNIHVTGLGGEPIAPVKELTVEQLMAGWGVLQNILRGEECKLTQQQQPLSGSPVPSSRRGRRTEL